MNRIITILVTIFILLLLYIWISHVWGSDKPRHPRQLVDAKETQISDELLSDADTVGIDGELLQNDSEEADNGNSLTSGDQKVTEAVKTPKVEEKKAVETKKTEPKSTPKTTPKTESKPPVTKSQPTPTPTKPTTSTESSTSIEQHLVIAGNFTQKTNAEQRVKELKKAGFSETEIVNFDLSEYFTVCVGRFSDVNEARRLVKKLKDYHKIDAYVRIGG